MLWNATLDGVIRRLNDWLTASSESAGGGNLALDLANRGQAKLWAEADWEPLIKRQSLTLNSSNEATVPADFGKEIRIYADPFGYGKEIVFYNKDGDLIYGYRNQNSFDKTTGFAARVLHFYFPLMYTPILVYKAVLSDFIGAQAGGTYTEKSFFPENLLVRAAQLEHVAENRFDDNEYKIIQAEYLRELAKYKAQVQGVNADYRFDIKDDSGNKVRVVSNDSAGGQIGPRLLSPSMDVRWNT